MAEMDNIQEYESDEIMYLGDVPTSTLDEPDYDQMKNDRVQRTRTVMKAVDASLTSQFLPLERGLNRKELATICLQRHLRGYLGRKEYTARLFDKFEEEERMRRDKMQQQLEEGELLVENHKLEVLIDDESTSRRNRDRHYLCKVITIQRAWRAYLERKAFVSSLDLVHSYQSRHQARSLNPLASDVTDKQLTATQGQGESNHTSDDECENSETESAVGGPTMTLSTPEENQDVYAGIDSQTGVPDLKGQVPKVLPVALKTLQDVDCESLHSDYSELGGPLKELESEVDYVGREDLKNKDFSQLGAPSLSGVQNDPSYAHERLAGETDDDYCKRQRKLNFLSLAQEFAELKKINADACPIDFHLSQGYANLSTLTSTYNSMDKRNSLSEADQSVDSADLADTMNSNTQGSDKGGVNSNFLRKKDTQFCAGGNSVVMRDNSPRRALSKSRDGTPKRNSLQGTPKREARSCSATRDRPVSQPVDGDFEIFTMESSMPAMNWELLEQQLQRAAEDERNRREARHNDREEIRRKLAMGTDEDYYGGERAFKKPSLSTRLQGGMNLQICFVNDAAADDTETSTTTATTCIPTNTSSQSHYNLSTAGMGHSAGVGEQSFSGGQQARDSRSRPLSDPGLLSAHLSLPPSAHEEETIAERQQRLQQEAKMALAQASTMARMQLEVERQTKKKSPIADIVGVPELGDGRRMKISRKLLYEMNLAQLQVLVNDLHSQIECLNEELVHLLIERDDLHMEQDSMLVDIEDLTSFAQHMSENNNNKSTISNRNSGLSQNKRLK